MSSPAATFALVAFGEFLLHGGGQRLGDDVDALDGLAPSGGWPSAVRSTARPGRSRRSAGVLRAGTPSRRTSRTAAMSSARSTGTSGRAEGFLATISRLDDDGCLVRRDPVSEPGGEAGAGLRAHDREFVRQQVGVVVVDGRARAAAASAVAGEHSWVHDAVLPIHGLSKHRAADPVGSSRPSGTAPHHAPDLSCPIAIPSKPHSGVDVG